MLGELMSTLSDNELDTSQGSAASRLSVSRPALRPGDPVPEAPARAEVDKRAEVAGLEHQVLVARARAVLQVDPALAEVLSDEELARDRELAEWARDQRRDQRKRAIGRELAREDAAAKSAGEVDDRRRRHEVWRARRELSRDAQAVKVAERIEDEQAADGRWHRRALIARRRLTSPDARLAQLFRRMVWSGRALIAVVLVGMLWSAVNVQRGLVPSGDRSDPLWWLSFGIEAMLSVPLIVIMLHATAAAMWGREVNRGQVVLMEAGLLLVNVGLNAGPHLIREEYRQAAESVVAPVMVAVIIWLHAWISAQYADLISSVHVPGEDDGGRLGEDTAKLLDAVALVQQGMRSGVVQPSEDGGPAPSASRIARVWGLSKGDAGLVRDAINRLQKEPMTT